MGIERGKRNNNDFIILTKAGCLVNNKKQEKSRVLTKVLYVDKINWAKCTSNPPSIKAQRANIF